MTDRLDSADVLALGPDAAMQAVRGMLTDGFDPDHSVPRSVVDLAHGQALLMPAEARGWFGLKVATVAPGNPAAGLDRIGGIYLLHDSASLRLAAILDGVALTTLRTPAVSVAAGLSRIRSLAASSPSGLRLLVFGAGPQSHAHVQAVAAQAPVAEVTVVTRTPRPAPAWATRHLPAGHRDLSAVLRSADVVITATSSREPVLDGRLVRDNALVVAIGSHEPAARELDGPLLHRSTVVVESREVARREAGDIIIAVAEGHLNPASLVTMRELVGGESPLENRLPNDRPFVVKTSGMAWEDLAVASAAYHRWRNR